MSEIKKYLLQFNFWCIRLGDGFTIKRHPVRTTISVLLFLLALNWFYYYVGIYSFLEVRPSSIHSSAQCQRASIALNYYEVDMNFFKPRVQIY